MVDLTAEMAGLWSALGAGPDHRGRLIMFVGAISGEGVSTVSREFARIAAVRAAKPVWLVDADLSHQSQQFHLAQNPDRFGRAGPLVAGSPDGSSFFTVKPALYDANKERVRPAKFLTARPFMGRRLYATRIQTEAFGAGQFANALKQGDYWAALSQHADTIIVDVPSVQRDDAALKLAPFMDDVIIVLGENAEVGGPIRLKEQIQSVGGRISGMIINKSTYKPPKMLRKFMA